MENRRIRDLAMHWAERPDHGNRFAQNFNNFGDVIRAGSHSNSAVREFPPRLCERRVQGLELA